MITFEIPHEWFETYRLEGISGWRWRLNDQYKHLEQDYRVVIEFPRVKYWPTTFIHFHDSVQAIEFKLKYL